MPSASLKFVALLPSNAQAPFSLPSTLLLNSLTHYAHTSLC